MGVSAPVKKCPVCSRLNQPVALFCLAPGCNSSLRFVKPAVFPGFQAGDQWSDESATPIEPPAEAPPPVQDPPAGATRRELPPFLATLRFPWGDVTMSDRLAAGRNPAFSPLAAELGHARYQDTVSGRHAEFAVDESGLSVVDLNSTNGTFVNGLQLVAHQSHRLATGDRIRFGQRVEVEVAMLRRMGT